MTPGLTLSFFSLSLVSLSLYYSVCVIQETTNSTNSSGSSWWRFEQTQIDVLDHFLPESNSFRLTNLTTNTSYVFAMICILWVGSEAGGNAQHAEELGGTNHQPKSAMNGHHHYGTITSNPIFFTTSRLYCTATLTAILCDSALL